MSHGSPLQQAVLAREDSEIAQATVGRLAGDVSVPPS